MALPSTSYSLRPVPGLLLVNTRAAAPLDELAVRRRLAFFLARANIFCGRLPADNVQSSCPLSTGAVALVGDISGAKHAGTRFNTRSVEDNGSTASSIEVDGRFQSIWCRFTLFNSSPALTQKHLQVIWLGDVLRGGARTPKARV